MAQQLIRQSTLLDAPTLCAMSAASAYDAAVLAARLGVTPRHLNRLFSRYLDCSPERWLREQRLQVALRLLPTAGSVKEVAYGLAFPQASQFCRDFRARFGFRPSALITKSEPE
jgi:AraC family transcriptional regulator of adaptative response / DNA-3-methyladenine glycosylase II